MTIYTKDPVKLRVRPINDGRKSLYLDIRYNGRRKTEALKLYLEAGTSPAVKARNRETLQIAESVRASRILSIRNKTFQFADTAEMVDFVKFSAEIISRKPSTVRQNLRSTLLKVVEYAGERLLFREITREWVEGFLSFLEERGLSPNTQHLYHQRLREMLGWGVREEIIRKNPADGVQPPRREDSKREFLTVEELRAMARTFARADVAHPFIFSCLTGLRRCDIKQLRWRDVEENEKGARIVFRQQKTHELQYLELSEQALAVMGVRWNDEDLVFPMPNDTTCNDTMKRWARAAGVKKKITFHCGRHTFATLQIAGGTDIYIVSKLLGHRSVKTTQVYAKVLDDDRRRAMENLPKIL